MRMRFGQKLFLKNSICYQPPHPKPLRGLRNSIFALVLIGWGGKDLCALYVEKENITKQSPQRFCRTRGENFSTNINYLRLKTYSLRLPSFLVIKKIFWTAVILDGNSFPNS